jgi:hypothetical protein
MVGATRFEDLGDFYETERKLFSEATTINVHRYTASKFATYHLDDPRASALSEITHALMKQLNLEQSKDTATGLLAGIDQATNNLMSPNVTADTFEAVANLLRAGGLRQAYSGNTQSRPNPVVPIIQPASTPPMNPISPQSHQVMVIMCRKNGSPPKSINPPTPPKPNGY